MDARGGGRRGKMEFVNLATGVCVDRYFVLLKGKEGWCSVVRPSVRCACGRRAGAIFLVFN